jgi:hypothetical protein
MQKFRKIRNANLKKIMINKKSQRSKSVHCNSKKNNQNENVSNKLEKNENILPINNDFELKNEIDLADKIFKANQLKIEENKLEEQEINLLNEQIRKIMLNNYDLEKKIQYHLNLRLTYEKNQKEMASYINNLNYKFRHYDETVKEFESMMNKLKGENKKLANEYDKKIEKIEKENDKLKKRVQDRIDLYIYQKGEIEEKTVKTKNLENEIKAQEKLVADRVNLNKAKIKELEEKYDNMYKKIINLEVNLEDKKYRLFDTDLFTIDENNTNVIFDKNKLNQEIKDKENNKNKNREEITDINNKIEDFESNNEALLYELIELNKQYESLLSNKRKNDFIRNKEGKPTFSFSSNRSTTSNYNTYINNIKDFRETTPRALNDSKYK